MADISIKRDHELSPEEVEAAIERLAEKLADRLGGTWRWHGKTAVCEARGAKARVDYDEQYVALDVTLPMMLKPLRGKLESKVDEYFATYFRKA
jgi:putative polyhydroxyalkanoate system protein